MVYFSGSRFFWNPFASLMSYSLFLLNISWNASLVKVGIALILRSPKSILLTDASKVITVDLFAWWRAPHGWPNLIVKP